jgi:hypothetical protein
MEEHAMLTYQQLETIAKILGWTVQEVENSLAELNDGFMVPDVELLAGNPDTGNYLDPTDPRHVESGPGYFSRLSAPGYMDCTGWNGPYETEEEAVAELLSVYAD